MTEEPVFAEQLAVVGSDHDPCALGDDVEEPLEDRVDVRGRTDLALSE